MAVVAGRKEDDALLFPLRGAETGVHIEGPPGLLGTISQADVTVKDLGRCRMASPVADHLGENAMLFVGEADKVLVF